MLKNDLKNCIIVTAYIEGSIKDILSSFCYYTDEGRLEKVCPDKAGIGNTQGIADEILRDSFILCADAGYENALAEGIRPDLIMGDFDSLKGSLPDDIEIVTHPVHKDDTDTGLALRYALSKGFKNVTIVGGIGGRMDHTLANIQDIVGYTGKGLQVIMKDGRNMFTVLRDGIHTIPRFEGHCVSQFAHGGPAEVSITGVEYPLNHHTLTCDFPLGVSNEFREDTITLTVHSGTILLIISK